MIRQMRTTVVAAGAAVALATVLAAGVAAQGEGPGRRGGFRHGPGGFPRLAALNLTDAQREQVREVMQRHRGEMQAAGVKLREAHQAQRQAIETVPVNEGLVRSASQAVGEAQTEMAVLQARIHSEVWSLLTAEQQQKAQELKQERESRRQERAARPKRQL